MTDSFVFESTTGQTGRSEKVPLQIYLLEVRDRRWVFKPEGTYWDDGGFVVETEAKLPEWVKPFITCEEGEGCWIPADDDAALDAGQVNFPPGAGGMPYVLEQWRLFQAFEHREDAQAFGEKNARRWDGYRVTAVNCSESFGKVLETAKR